MISAGPSEQTHTGVGWGSAGHSTADEAMGPGEPRAGVTGRRVAGLSGVLTGHLQVGTVAWAVWGLAHGHTEAWGGGGGGTASLLLAT